MSLVDTQSTDTEELPILAHKMEEVQQTAGTEPKVCQEDKSTGTKELPILANEFEHTEQTVMVDEIT